MCDWSESVLLALETSGRKVSGSFFEVFEPFLTFVLSQRVDLDKVSAQSDFAEKKILMPNRTTVVVLEFSPDEFR